MVLGGTSLAVQWLRLCTSTAGGMGSIPDRGTKIPYALWHGQKTNQKKEVSGKLDRHMQKNKTGPVSYTVHKINSKWIKAGVPNPWATDCYRSMTG